MHIADLFKVVSESPFFHTMEEDERLELARTGSIHEYNEGEVLFSPRDVPAALYLVVDGVAEISRREAPDADLEPVAYAGTGAIMASSKVITGTPFEAMARFPEGGRTLQWPRTLILRRLGDSQSFSMQYLQNLAGRLEGRLATLGGRVGSKLRGRLDHFDLASILQTVVDSGASGVLEVADSRGNKHGAIYTENRRIGPVLSGSLSGFEAFYEILVTPPERGTFIFSSVSPRGTGEQRYDLQPLLFEAARMQDELLRFQDELEGNVPLCVSGRQLEWRDGRNLDLVERIWHAIAADPIGWQPLARRLPYSRCQVALVVRDLLQSGVLVVADDTDTAKGGG
jgi:CRP-like cAMP-binding protein